MGSASRYKGREEKSGRVLGASAAGSRKVVMDFPGPLFERTERPRLNLRSTAVP
jgi:hypothetical protein